MRRDLADPELFGNEAGEDEPIDVLSSYFLNKPEFDRFYSSSLPFSVVRSRKGVGKSALLKQTLATRRSAKEPELLIYVKAPDLIALQEFSAESPAALIYGWQQRICSRINLEIGAQLALAVSDDSHTLIEKAELAGFRQRNLISTLVDRLKIKGVVDLERGRPVPSDSTVLLKRVMDKRDTRVWILIDDVDATFLNTDRERIKASTFFSACRDLTHSVTGLNIRASVRSDVWSTLAHYDESLDKCEQYVLDLAWGKTETKRILEKKILSYFTRFYPDDRKYAGLSIDDPKSRVSEIVFAEPFPWGKNALPAYRPIHVLSAGRPRWAAHLCKLAGNLAFDKRLDRITWDCLKYRLREYGQARLADLYKEHRHQYPTMQDAIESFSKGKARFTTRELFTILTERVIKPLGLPQIDGISAVKGSITLANFLYRIGFIAARDETDSAGLDFVRYEERPDLLSTTVNLDDGMVWEIHPSYREALGIRKVDSSAGARTTGRGGKP